MTQTLYIKGSALIYEGPSMINGSGRGDPIAVIVTGLKSASDNTKTGDMLQTWIIRADADPIASAHNGEDIAICGRCPHRWNPVTGTRTCFVTLHHAPLAVYSAYIAGRYRPMSLADLPALGAGRKVRLGSYGDPAAVPVEIWRALVSRAAGWTGYTHQWLSATHLRGLCMASVDSPAERRLAQSRGWRTFRVSDGVDPESGEILCPASEEAGHRTQCARCGLCSGVKLRADGRRMIPSVTIPAHGSQRRHFKVAA